MTLSAKTLLKLRELINEGTQYRSGPSLIAFFAQLGFHDIYGRGFGSRKDYTDNKLRAINGTSDLDKCIKLLFSPVEFVENIQHLDKCIDAFNAYLMFDGWRVVRDNAEITFIRTSANVDELIDLAKEQNRTHDDGLELFMKKQFDEIDFSRMPLESRVEDVLLCRLNELKGCINLAPLASVLLAGSILECVLLSVGMANRHDFEKSIKAPPNKHIEDWRLKDFIEVAYNLGYIKMDVYKFSSTLRQFRNYIHPHRQIMENFSPDRNTAHICFHVLKGAIAQIKEKL